jgi:hypothetical protein
MKFAVQRRLRERCSDVVALGSDGSEVVKLPGRCSLQLPSTTISRAAIDLSDTPELEQELARHIGDLDVKIGRFDRWLQVARDTRQALEKE